MFWTLGDNINTYKMDPARPQWPVIKHTQMYIYEIQNIVGLLVNQSNTNNICTFKKLSTYGETILKTNAHGTKINFNY